MTLPLIPALTLARPWLRLDLRRPHRVLSWAINRPGFVTADTILWREVRNADLTADLDVGVWLERQLRARGDADAVTFLTSRDITAHHDTRATADGITARCVATVGLSNAEAVGARLDRSGKDWGTINTAVLLDASLTDAAMIEALSIAAQARTAAVLSLGYVLPTGPASGTGTDCIALAARPGDMAYAGLHTGVGEAIGRAVYDAVRAGGQEWMDTVRREGEF